MANAEHVPRLARHGDIKLTQQAYTDYESLAGGSGRRERAAGERLAEWLRR